MKKRCEILLVTCCLDASRYELLKQVVENLEEQDPSLFETIEVVDNDSTYPGTDDLLRRFNRRYRASHNGGYWSAVNWWIESFRQNEPSYTYIIESDMIHYGLRNLERCLDFLDENPSVGSMRLHEYSIADRHLYDKDRPLPNSRRNLWQSHTNKVTNEPVKFSHVRDEFWTSNFLTQLPAINRYHAMSRVFSQLAKLKGFTELDFQRMYHDRYPISSIIDGGIFHCDLNPYGTDVVTGSWTDPKRLKQMGYMSTRVSSIQGYSEYIVTDMDEDRLDA